MTYEQVAGQLGEPMVCLGECGITRRSHRTGFVFLSVVHFAERRVTRRGLRRFLLLLARRARESNNWLENGEQFLNARRLTYYHLWSDEQYANMLAGLLGVRFPAEFSKTERLRCLASARAAGVALSTKNRAIFSWAKRGLS